MKSILYSIYHCIKDALPKAKKNSLLDIQIYAAHFISSKLIATNTVFRLAITLPYSSIQNHRAFGRSFNRFCKQYLSHTLYANCHYRFVSIGYAADHYFGINVPYFAQSAF